MSARLAREVGGRHGLDAVAGSSQGATRSFHTLDALRGIAAITVVLYHAAFVYGIAPPAEGQMAVDLFFVMSGFIIAYRYDRDLRAGLSLRAFLTIRLVRLYPLYALGAALAVLPPALAILAGDGDAFHRGLVASLPLHLLMLPSHLVASKLDELFPLNYVAWSLALEFAINLAYAASVRFWTLSRLLVLIGCAFAALCACDVGYGRLIGGFDWANAPVGVARILYGFPVGIVLYRLFEMKAFRIRLPWWSLLVAVAALFAFDAQWAKPLWELVAIAAIVPLIVAAACANEPPPAARGLCALAGTYSYVVYSLHAPFVGFFLRGEERLNLDLNAQSSVRALVFTLLLVATCLAAHLAYDKPLRRALSRRFVWPRSRGATPVLAIAVKS